MRLDQIRDGLREAINRKAVDISGRLLAGAVADHAGYTKLVGRLQGHSDAQEAIDAFFNKLLDEEDE